MNSLIHFTMCHDFTDLIKTLPATLSFIDVPSILQCSHGWIQEFYKRGQASGDQGQSLVGDLEDKVPQSEA